MLSEPAKVGAISTPKTISEIHSRGSSRSRRFAVASPAPDPPRFSFSMHHNRSISPTLAGSILSAASLRSYCRSPFDDPNAAN
jgi:hypothetical protein